MPPYEAMETVLPEYQYIFVDPRNQTGPKKAPSPTGRVRPQPPADTTLPGAYGTSISEG